MSNSISLPFLIMAAGTILFVYMSVVIMELRSAYEESFWKQALKIGGIIFTLITLLFLGLDFVLTRFREKAFLLAPGMPILGIILVYTYIGDHPCVHEKYCAGMAVAEKESVSCPYPDEKTRRFPESRRRRNPFCRRRADSKIESGCCGRKERIYSSRGAQAGNGGIYLAAPAVEYTVFSK